MRVLTMLVECGCTVTRSRECAPLAASRLQHERLRALRRSLSRLARALSLFTQTAAATCAAYQFGRASATYLESVQRLHAESRITPRHCANTDARADGGGTSVCQRSVSCLVELVQALRVALAKPDALLVC